MKNFLQVFVLVLSYNFLISEPAFSAGWEFNAEKDFCSASATGTRNLITLGFYIDDKSDALVGALSSQFDFSKDFSVGSEEVIKFIFADGFRMSVAGMLMDKNTFMFSPYDVIGRIESKRYVRLFIANVQVGRISLSGSRLAIQRLIGCVAAFYRN